jgi:hypothetical protein
MVQESTPEEIPAKHPTIFIRIEEGTREFKKGFTACFYNQSGILGFSRQYPTAELARKNGELIAGQWWPSSPLVHQTEIG